MHMADVICIKLLKILFRFDEWRPIQFSYSKLLIQNISIGFIIKLMQFRYFRPVNQTCLDQNLLLLTNGSSRYYFPDYSARNFTVTLQLPASLTCTQCVLQWKWHCGKYLVSSQSSPTNSVMQSKKKWPSFLSIIRLRN